MGSDPTLNKGNEKPTRAAYPIAVKPLCVSRQGSWTQLFPHTANRMGLNFAYGPFTQFMGVCIKPRPRDKFSPPFTADLKKIV